MLRSATFRDLILLTGLACITMTIALGDKSVIMDESTSILYARLPISSLADVVTRHDPNMGLYYVVLSIWQRLVGETEIAVRSLSALSAVLAVGAIYLVGCELFNRRAGVMAGVLLALNAFVVTFAQIARSYSMVVLLVTLSSLFFVREMQRPSTANRIWYVTASVLSIHAHYFAAFVLAAHAVTVLVRSPGAITRPWLTVAAAIVVLCLPETVIAFSSGAASGIDWIDPVSLSQILPVLTELAGGHRLVLGVLIMAGCYGAVTAWRRREARWPWGIVAAWLLLPVGLSLAISFAKPMFLSHYLIVCAPALVLFGSAGIDRIHPRAVGFVTLAFVVWTSVGQLRGHYDRSAVQDWRGLTQYVLTSARHDDGVVFFPDGARKPFEYYVRRSGLSGPKEVTAPTDSPSRVWFVVRDSDLNYRAATFRESEKALASRYQPAGTTFFGWVRVDLYTR